MSFLPSVIRADYRTARVSKAPPRPRRGKLERVPIISVFFGIIIRMFYREHEPVHFHAEGVEGPVFAPLKRPSYFRRFFLDGGAIAWPNGD